MTTINRPQAVEAAAEQLKRVLEDAYGGFWDIHLSLDTGMVSVSRDFGRVASGSEPAAGSASGRIMALRDKLDDLDTLIHKARMTAMIIGRTLEETLFPGFRHAEDARFFHIEQEEHEIIAFLAFEVSRLAGEVQDAYVALHPDLAYRGLAVDVDDKAA